MANTKQKKVYLKPIIHGNVIDFEIAKGNIPISLKQGWQQRGNLVCPCCGNITNVENIKRQSIDNGLPSRLLTVITEGISGKNYRLPSKVEIDIVNSIYSSLEITPQEKIAKNSGGGDTLSWGVTKWGELFSNRQLVMLNAFVKQFKKQYESESKNDYNDAVSLYLAIWIDRICLYNTTFGVYESGNEKVNRIFGRQAIPMVFDYPESNPFCGMAGSALNQLEWITKYIESEGHNIFNSKFANASSGEKTQFKEKSLTVTITDPPYYDAIAYADISDFFYVWLKKTLGSLYPLVFATPQTPKKEECTALKHYHNGNYEEAKLHFQTKLTSIFDAIEQQTSDLISIMFAHQSTEAWTTLCDSILKSRMNITGSWPMETEMAGGMKTDKATLESSVTVACRPSERKGFADFDEVKHDIRQLVKAEVEKLYGLGFRGADLLTACFGQAVSVFGHYKLVETAEGDPVSVGQLLEFARESAAQALLEGVPGEPQTKFYCGWLQMNGMSECDFDDVNKYTRVGVNVEIRSLQSDKLLITEGSKQHLATAEEHVGSNQSWGTQPTDYMISQVHRMMLAYRGGNQVLLLKLVRELCPQSDAPQWRVLDFLGGHLPEGKDLNDVKGILASAEMLRQKCKEAVQHQEGSLDFE